MNSTASSTIEIFELSKTIGNKKAVNNITTIISNRQNLAIIGETGSGKSTLLKLIYGLEQPDTGFLTYLGEKIKGPDFQLIPGHPEMSYLSQQFELSKHYLIKELLHFNNEFADEETATILRLCKIDHLIDRKTSALSGGERQRVALALQLLKKPKVLLLDEPFSNLDFTNRKIIQSILEEIKIKLDLTIIMVSHDTEDVLSWAERIIIMKDGEIVQDNTTNIIYSFPENEYCAGLLGSYSVVDANELSYFGKNKGIKELQPNEKIFLRPEDIIIDKAAPSEYVLKVKSISFRGHYSIIETEINGNIIFALSASDQFSVGSPIKLSLKNTTQWRFMD